MGTSSSGTGPGSGVPLVPPWVPDPLLPVDDPDGEDEEGNEQEPRPETEPQREVDPLPRVEPQPTPVAPRGRFAPARTNLGRFASTGGSVDMHRGLGHYVHKGLGGARTAASRMGGTALNAGALYGALALASAGQAAAEGSPFDPVLLAGRSANEVMDALVEAVRPVDGTQDAEASRAAIREAVAELLDHFHDTDLLGLSEAQRLFVIERYLAFDIYNRFNLDLGKTVQDKAPSPDGALSRLKEIKDYIKQTVSAKFRDLRKAGEPLSVRRIVELARRTLHQTFVVFEEYVR